MLRQVDGLRISTLLVSALTLGLGCSQVEPLETSSSSSGTDGDTDPGTTTAATDAPTGSTSAAGSGTPGLVSFFGDVATAPACDTVGAVAVQWQATRVGCVDPPPAPCTLPGTPRPVEGDLMTCPQTDASVLLGVEVEQSGRYIVEAVLQLTSDEPEPECYADAGVTEIIVTDEQIAAGAVVMVTPTGSPCP